MLKLSVVMAASAVLFLDVPLGSDGTTTIIERMGVIFHSYHRSSRPHSPLIILFWDDVYEMYREVEIRLIHVIRPISSDELLIREDCAELC